MSPQRRGRLLLYVGHGHPLNVFLSSSLVVDNTIRRDGKHVDGYEVQSRNALKAGAPHKLGDTYTIPWYDKVNQPKDPKQGCNRVPIDRDGRPGTYMQRHTSHTPNVAGLHFMKVSQIIAHTLVISCTSMLSG